MDAILACIYYIFCGRENSHSICGSIGPSQGTSDERFKSANIQKVRLKWARFSGLASGWVAWKGNEASTGTQCDATFKRPKKHPQKTHPHLPLSFFSSESRCFCKILRSHIWRCGCWSDTHGLCRCAAGCMRCWPRPAFSKNTDNPKICLNVNHNLPDLGPQINLMFDQHQPDKGPLLGAEKAPLSD